MSTENIQQADIQATAKSGFYLESCPNINGFGVGYQRTNGQKIGMTFGPGNFFGPQNCTRQLGSALGFFGTTAVLAQPAAAQLYDKTPSPADRVDICVQSSYYGFPENVIYTISLYTNYVSQEMIAAVKNAFEHSSPKDCAVYTVGCQTDYIHGMHEFIRDENGTAIGEIFANAFGSSAYPKEEICVGNIVKSVLNIITTAPPATSQSPSPNITTIQPTASTLPNDEPSGLSPLEKGLVIGGSIALGITFLAASYKIGQAAIKRLYGAENSDPERQGLINESKRTKTSLGA